LVGKGTVLDGERHGFFWGKARGNMGKSTEVDGERHGGLWISKKAT